MSVGRAGAVAIGVAVHVAERGVATTPTPGRAGSAGAATELSKVLAVAARLGWGRVEVAPVTRGHIHDSYFVVAEGGHDEYVLQNLNRSVFPEPEKVASNILALHDRLGTGLVPEPVLAPDGHWLVEEDGQVWRAYRWVHGAELCDRPTEAPAREAGALLGRFHRAVAGFDPSRFEVTLPGFHDLRRRVDALRAEADRDPCGRVDMAQKEIEAAFGSVRLVEVAEALVGSVPLRVAHYDAKLDNVLFRHGEAVCLVDLDTVMPGQWFWDLGDLLRTATTVAAEDSTDEDAEVDPVLYDAVLAGYLGALPDGLLEPSELAALDVAGAISTYEQGVRFLTDWLSGDRYFRVNRADQNLDRARTQFRLLATMPTGSSRTSGGSE